jgi:hypothetical protein
MDKLNKEYIGHLDQLFYARTIHFDQGRSGGMRGVLVKNGPLQFILMPDKCLDIAELSYRGENFSFMTKPGLQGRNHYDTRGQEAQHSIMGGMLFTCGLENVCAPCSSRGRDYSMHGRIRTTPCEHLSTSIKEEDGIPVLTVSGVMREAELFGRNLIFQRTITCQYGSTTVHIHDELKNEAFREEPFSLLYHFNAGYPFLDDSCYLKMDSNEVIPHNRHSQKGLDKWMTMERPVAGEQEQVFLHHVRPDENQRCSATIVNPVQKKALRFDWNNSQLKYCVEWKSLASGDYVWAIEPTNSTFEGRAVMEEKREMETLKPMETRSFDVELTVLEGDLFL